jgi:hypothetical protein
VSVRTTEGHRRTAGSGVEPVDLAPYEAEGLYDPEAADADRTRELLELLAARLTAEAEPDQLLISEDAAAAIDPARWDVGAPASLTLRGFPDPVPAIELRRR